MPKTRIYKCNACHRSHAKPTGKQCQWVEQEQLAEPAEKDDRTDVLTAAIQKLTANVEAMGKKIGEMDKRFDGEPDEAPDSDLSDNENDNVATAATSRTERDIPSARELRRDYEVGRELNRRLAELEADADFAENARPASQRMRGKRSGAARTVQDSIKRDIDWPHFHIYAPPGAEPMTFERLSVQEFVYGFMHMVDQPDTKLDRAVMWEILKGMMDDAIEYPWHNVKNYYWIVGSHVENERLDWADTDQIQRLRSKHAQKHDLPVKKPQAQATKAEKLRPCALYQKGSCPEKGDHSGQGHICAYCYRVKGAPYKHSEADCIRRATDETPKNGKGGE